MNARNQLVALIALAVIAVACVIGGIVLADGGKDVPEFLVGTGGVAVGAMAGIVTGSKNDA